MGLEKLGKTKNVVTKFNNMKDIFCLDLRCAVKFCFTSNFQQVCLNLYAALFIV